MILGCLLSMLSFLNKPWPTGMSVSGRACGVSLAALSNTETPVQVSNMVVSIRLRCAVSRRVLQDPRAHVHRGKFSGVSLDLYSVPGITPQLHMGYNPKTKEQQCSMVVCAGLQEEATLMKCVREIDEIARKYALKPGEE